MKIIGIDLSGPSNPKDTAVVICKEKDSQLFLEEIYTDVSDERLLNLLQTTTERTQKIFIGMDAPLSYQDGGGDRASDRSLRNYAKTLGVKPGSIMPPTLTRMIYLTARGIHLAHMLSQLYPQTLEIIEVHPGITLASRLPSEDRLHALLYKKEEESRQFVIDWLEEHYFNSLEKVETSSTHQLDACLAALACWHWVNADKQSSWQMPAQPPHHPFPFSC